MWAPRVVLVLSQCKIHQHMKSQDHLANKCTKIQVNSRLLFTSNDTIACIYHISMPLQSVTGLVIMLFDGCSKKLKTKNQKHLLVDTDTENTSSFFQKIFFLLFRSVHFRASKVTIGRKHSKTGEIRKPETFENRAFCFFVLLGSFSCEYFFFNKFCVTRIDFLPINKQIPQFLKREIYFSDLSLSLSLNTN